MQPTNAPQLTPQGPTQRPRWVFRGDAGAWDALLAQVAADPTAPARWPIAPSGPSMAEGEQVLLWRAGRGGGIVASCTVVAEPEASVGEDGRPRVTVGLRIDRAHQHPIAPAALARVEVLRPLAFMDLLGDTERRLSLAQQDALADLVAARDHRDVSDDPDDVRLEETATIRVPVRILPVVEQLLAVLGANDPAPAPSGPAHRRPDATGARNATTRTGRDGSASGVEPLGPTAQQLALVASARAAHADAPFTVDEIASTWRTGIGTARSRIERLVEVGLLERAGTQRPTTTQAGRPTRGRPPVLYRLASPDRSS
jgi:hypothetical protein